MNKGALIVFAKAPVVGNVKTRLIPHIGEDKATSVYISLLEKTLDTALNSNFTDIQLWIEGDIEHEFFRNMPERDKFHYYLQSGTTLGERMYAAFECALKTYSYAVLIGSDCPGLSIADLDETQALLQKNDIVLGPAKDGGYYLIALSNNHFSLFEGIAWSQETVFAETRERINLLNWRMGLLQERWDVDDEEGLHNYISMYKNLKL